MGELAHPWPQTLDEAKALQNELRARVITTDRLGPVRTIAGVDSGYEGDVVRAAIVVLEYPSFAPLDYALARRPAPIAYVPGFLSFREAPAVMAALEALSVRPDLLMVDGQGIAHPRRFGIASHLGVLADLPSIGCAKSILAGHHGPIGYQRGDRVPLVHRGEEVGAVLRTRAGVSPVYVSVGHRISLETAVSYVLGGVTRYRLPEPIRAAHNLASHGTLPKGAGVKQGGEPIARQLSLDVPGARSRP